MFSGRRKNKWEWIISQYIVHRGGLTNKVKRLDSDKEFKSQSLWYYAKKVTCEKISDAILLWTRCCVTLYEVYSCRTLLYSRVWWFDDLTSFLYSRCCICNIITTNNQCLSRSWTRCSCQNLPTKTNGKNIASIVESHFLFVKLSW